MNLRLLALIALFFTANTATLLAQEDAPKKDCEARKESRAEVREELKIYRKEVIRPEVLKVRVAFDEKLQEEDRTELERLRAVMKSRPKPNREARPEEREERRAARVEMHQKFEAWREAHSADFASLDRLLKKYAEELGEVRTTLEKKQPEWEAHRKSVMEKHELGQSKGGKDGNHHHPRHRHARKHVKADDTVELSHEERHELHRQRRFLLLNPNKREKQDKKAQSQGELDIEMSVFPNPASGVASVTFDLPKEMNLRLSIIDESGRAVRKLGRRQLNSGRQNIEFDLSGFKSGRYTVVAANKNGRKTVLLIVK